MTDSVYRTDALIAEDINAYLEAQQNKSLLRFITCGSVDDGKSTLIGRLLYDSKMIFEDQLAQLEADSKTQGTQGQEIDFALLVDGWPPARAGDYYRRGLSLLCHGEAQVYRSRYASVTSKYTAQYGYGCFHCRPGRYSHRCQKRRADSDATP